MKKIFSILTITILFGCAVSTTNESLPQVQSKQNQSQKNERKFSSIKSIYETEDLDRYEFIFDIYVLNNFKNDRVSREIDSVFTTFARENNYIGYVEVDRNCLKRNPFITYDFCGQYKFTIQFARTESELLKRKYFHSD